MKKKLPEFQNEADEQDFWSEHDSADYVDWSKARSVVLGNLKPSDEDDIVSPPPSRRSW
jgi:hypothetical protein